MPRPKRSSIPKLEPIRRGGVMDTVVQLIERMMRDGDLKIGDRLPPEPELARTLNISRSSLREALKGLIYLGLLRARPGDGTYIQPSLSRVLNQHFQWMILFHQIDAAEIYELRKIIEPEAAALAAQRATPAGLDRMSLALDAMGRTLNTPELFHVHDMEFHEAFMQASGNVALQTTMRMLYHATAEARLRVLPMIENMDAHFSRHERIYRHIAQHEPTLARKAVLADLLYAESLLQECPVSEKSKEKQQASRGRQRRTKAAVSN